MFKREKAAARESIRREPTCDRAGSFLRGETEKGPLEEPRAIAEPARPSQRFGEEENVAVSFRGVGRVIRLLERGCGSSRGGGGKQRNRRCCRAGRGRAEHARRHDAQRVRSLALRSACAALQHGCPELRRPPASGKSGGTGRGSRHGGPVVPHRCGFASFCRRGGIRREIRPAGDHGCGGVRNRSARVRIRLSDAAPESVFFPRPSS